MRDFGNFLTWQGTLGPWEAHLDSVYWEEYGRGDVEFILEHVDDDEVNHSTNSEYRACGSYSGYEGQQCVYNLGGPDEFCLTKEDGGYTNETFYATHKTILDAQPTHFEFIFSEDMGEVAVSVGDYSTTLYLEEYDTASN